jgi:transposase
MSPRKAPLVLTVSSRLETACRQRCEFVVRCYRGLALLGFAVGIYLCYANPSEFENTDRY